jgi:hypothetical protein
MSLRREITRRFQRPNRLIVTCFFAMTNSPRIVSHAVVELAGGVMTPSKIFGGKSSMIKHGKHSYSMRVWPCQLSNIFRSRLKASKDSCFFSPSAIWGTHLYKKVFQLNIESLFGAASLWSRFFYLQIFHRKPLESGAGSGNRTRVSTLGRSRSATEPYPHFLRSHLLCSIFEYHFRISLSQPITY